MNFGRRGERVSVGVRERSLFKTKMVQMSTNSPGFDCHGKVYLKNTLLCPKIIKVQRKMGGDDEMSNVLIKLRYIRGESVSEQ